MQSIMTIGLERKSDQSEWPEITKTDVSLNTELPEHFDIAAALPAKAEISPSKMSKSIVTEVAFCCLVAARQAKAHLRLIAKAKIMEMLDWLYDGGAQLLKNRPGR